MKHLSGLHAHFKFLYGKVIFLYIYIYLCIMILKRGTCDEYYTLYENIEHIFKTDYMKPTVFKNKIIYCNCDDYRWSNYVKFWKDNFTYFNIYKLVATNYDIGDCAYIYTYDGENETIEQGREDGSFEKYEDFMNEDVIVVTNPPFSKLKDYFSFLQRHDAKYYIHATFLKVVKFLPDLNNIQFLFYKKLNHYKVDDNISYIAASGIITNVGFDRTYSKVTLTKKFSEVDEDFYDVDLFYVHNQQTEFNDKILNVDWCNKIPYDYSGWMGVPISYLALQPEIRNKYHIYGVACYGNKFFRLVIKKKEHHDGYRALCQELKDRNLL